MAPQKGLMSFNLFVDLKKKHLSVGKLSILFARHFYANPALYLRLIVSRLIFLPNGLTTDWI